MGPMGLGFRVYSFSSEPAMAKLSTEIHNEVRLVDIPKKIMVSLGLRQTSRRPHKKKLRGNLFDSFVFSMFSCYPP